MLLMSNEASVTIHKYKYKFTNTNSQIQFTNTNSSCWYLWGLSAVSVSPQLTAHNLSNYSLHKSTQLCITVTTAGVTSQHIYIQHLLPTSTSSSDKVFPSCCFHNDTRVTDNGSYLVAVSWVSPQLLSLGWIDETWRKEHVTWSHTSVAQCTRIFTNFWRICLGSPRFWFDKLQKSFYRF